MGGRSKTDASTENIQTTEVEESTITNLGGGDVIKGGEITINDEFGDNALSAFDRVGDALETSIEQTGTLAEKAMAGLEKSTSTFATAKSENLNPGVSNMQYLTLGILTLGAFWIFKKK